MAKNKKRADGRYSCQVYLGKGPDGKRKYKTFYGSVLIIIIMVQGQGRCR